MISTGKRVRKIGMITGTAMVLCSGRMSSSLKIRHNYY
jgi:hypothetical protein